MNFASLKMKRKAGGNKAWKYGVGIGDFCYTIGLFRLSSGSKRNMPVVHFGTIARPIYGAAEDEELVPVKDWRDQSGQQTIPTRAYLIESQSLAGLSGAPVFVRPSNHHVSQDLIQANPSSSVEDMGDAIAMWPIFLIGVWQGAWDAPPGEVLAVGVGESARVPVGMGVVIPIDFVHYILASDELTEQRRQASLL